MQGERSVTVLRLGHRPGRDERMTTHVGLVARAFGADRAVLPVLSDAAGTVRDITARFGGPFEVVTTDDPRSVLDDWDGAMVHLTMYGQPIQDRMAAIQGPPTPPLLVVVGAGKVPFGVYERADWNVAVTNQPHSEVAALAVFLDRLFEGRELDRPWVDASHRVVPQATGKRVDPVDDDA